MRLILCNICKKEIKAKKAGFINLDMRDVNTGELDGSRKYDDWDLCDDCMQKLREFLETPIVRIISASTEPINTPQANFKPKAVIKKPISADTKWGPVTPEKIELIKQLVREGKTVKAIAEEVGVSDPTVRKYKREMMNEDSLSEILPED